MDFLLEPMELGVEFEDLLEPTRSKITCSQGYACETGTVETQQSG